MAFSSASAAASVMARHRHGGAARDAARHDAVDQRAARGLADHRQHVRFVGGIDADVAGNEFGGFSSSPRGRADCISMVVFLGVVIADW
jgi:hypothetical protein